jgi:hypothetical protein
MENEKSLMSQADIDEQQKLIDAGAGFTGGRKRGFFVPTIQLNNSDKVKKKWHVELGNFYLKYKKGDVETVEDLGSEIFGVILKTSYSIKSKFDPKGQVFFYSYEFDDFQDDEITVIDGNSKDKSVLYQGNYKTWKEQNQVSSRAGDKNDFNLNVQLYVLSNGDVIDPKVHRVTLGGKSMSAWFTYTSGDKKAGIKSIYDNGVYPHSHLHAFTSVEETNPKGEKFWYAQPSTGDKLELEAQRKVFNIQQELNAQIVALRGGTPPVAKPQEGAAQIGETQPEEDEVKIEDVPF